jgi:hypothetical protein
LTTDDAYAFDRIRQTVVSQFNFDDGILKTTLGCEKVTVSVPTSNGDAKAVWDEETSETGTFEPTYTMVYGSIDIEVSAIYAGSCLPTECDDIDPNILHAFDFCKPSVVAQLTPEQLACLEGEICVPLCDQLADVLPEDVVADVFDCLSLAAQTELLDQECVIPPCADATIEINGTAFGTVASGGTVDIPVINGGSNAVGSLQGSDWVIADTTLRNSAAPTWTDSVVSGVTKTLAQGKALDSDGATTLLADYIPEADGFMFTCTPIGAPSISISASTGNTTFGASVTFTAIPSVAFTPTSYRFEIVAGDSQIYTQTGSTYVWTVNRLGSVTVTVVAIGATTSAVDDVTITISEILSNTDLLINNESLFNGAASLPDATAISSVSDQSGASNTCNQSLVARQPRYYSNIINGLPAIRFGQTAATHLYSTNEPNVEMSETIVFKGIAGTASLLHIAATYNDMGNPFLILYYNSGPQPAVYFRNAGGWNYMGNVTSPSVAHVITITISSTLVSVYVDGAKIFERINSGSAGARTATFIGGAHLNSFSGYIGHQEQQSRAITFTEALQKHKVLSSKWGITLNN